MSLDRPEPTGGDRSEDETRRSEAETGETQRTDEGVQNTTQGEDETVQTTEEPIVLPVEITETTTPVVNTSNASDEEIHKMLENSPEPTPKKSKKSDQSDREKPVTLGTRVKIPTGHIVNTLRTQATCDFNVPSDQILGTF